MRKRVTVNLRKRVSTYMMKQKKLKNLIKNKRTKKKKKESISITMQREIRDKVFLGNTVSPYDNAGRSSAIDRTASNYSDVKEKILKN